MALTKKAYYKSEVLRVIVFPIIFLSVAIIFVILKIYAGEPIDFWIYVNLSLITLIATLISYALSYKFVKVKKKIK